MATLQVTQTTGRTNLHYYYYYYHKLKNSKQTQTTSTLKIVNDAKYAMKPDYIIFTKHK